ncbi:MAG: zinc-dependent alcohol dehydrogenase family protein [Thermodesulfobacteriota bacterium]
MLPAAMQVQLLEAPRPIGERPLRLARLPVPAPGPGEILLQVTVCGICHTDLHIVEGDLPLPLLPLVPGHQIVGRVVALGPGVEEPALGRRVGVAWVQESCGRCRFCVQNRPNLCPKIRCTGWHRHGGFAEFTVVPAAAAHPLPEGLPDAQAAPLLCAGIIGFRALSRSGIHPGGRLGLYGFGASGHLALQIARFWGCRVYVFTRSAHHQELARQLGAVWAGRAEEDPGTTMEAGIIFAPAGPLVPLALGHLERGACLALAGIHMSPLPELPYHLLYGERTITSVTNSTPEDARELLALAGQIPLLPTIEALPLAAANEALARLAAGRLPAAGVLTVADPAAGHP